MAAGLALLSAMIERRGPDHGVYCAIGKVNGVEVYCPELKLNGGWPAPFLYDTPGVSIEWQLSIGEDDFRTGPYIANFAFYLLILLAVDAGATAILRYYQTQ
jgi:hypothetical protein